MPSSKLVKTLSPEEEELQRKKEELASLEDQLAKLELNLSSHQADVSSFIASINAAIGRKLVEQALLQSKLAEARLTLEPDNEEYESQAEKAREDAEEAQREQEEFAGDPRSFRTYGDLESVQKARSSEEVRALYVKLVKLAHPDLTTDPGEKEKRTKFMQEVNAAYEMGDRQRIEELARQWEDSPESVKEDGVPADLVRVIRQISLVKERIEAAEKEIVEAEGSEDYLMLSEASAKGLATYIADLEAALDADIAQLERELIPFS